MPLKQCPRSGKLYNSADGPVHPECMADEEADYERVHAHLREHPHATHAEVEAGTGVEHGVLARMVEQGMIATLSQADVEKERKRLYTNEMQHLNSKVAEQIASIKLPEKKPVELGGAVRNLIQKKRRMEE